MASVVNTFTEGMNKDVNSMVAGQDILTDALNATIVTYNGDEFVLQQDFGNGRVETAYLPKGYVPVGIKEYAGIIYVACYNPMNGLCQVGSFPSPERNISSEELSQLSNNNIFKIHEQFSSIYEILSNDDIIRPGDKFSINLNIKEIKNNNGTETKSEIQLFDWIYNYQTDKSSANLIKLDLAIKTSDGNTIIITDKLKKVSIGSDPYLQQDDEGYIKDKDSKDGKLIPDRQYFYILEDFKYKIPEGQQGSIIKNQPEITGFWASTENNPTDINGYRERVDGKYLNVFNNKIAGQLVLIVSIPSIESFSMSVNSTKTSSNINLSFTPTITFQDIRQMVWFGGFILQTEYTEKNNEFKKLNEDKKPEGTQYQVYYVNDITRTSDKDGIWNYVIELEQGNIDKQQNPLSPDKIKSLTLRKNEIINNVSIKFQNGPESSLTDNIKVEYSSDNVFKNGDELIGFIKYQARPFMRYQSLKTYQVNDIIDVSLINSGTFEINRWNWFTNVDKGIFNLRYGIDAYNSSEVQFSQLLFYGYSLFDNIDGKSSNIYNLTINDHKIDTEKLKSDILFKSDELSSLKGTFTQTLYVDDNFNMQDLYVVRIFVKTIKNVDTKWEDLVNKPFEDHNYYIENDNKNIRYYLYQTRQFMTTSMFNQEYVNEYNTQKDFKDLNYKDLEYSILHDNDTFKLIDTKRDLIANENNKRFGTEENEPFSATYNTTYINNLSDKLTRKIINYNDLLRFPYDFEYKLLNESSASINNYTFFPEMIENTSTPFVTFQNNITLISNQNNNIFDYKLNINVQEYFTGFFSQKSNYKQKAFSKFYEDNTSKKIFGFQNNTLSQMLCMLVGVGIVDCVKRDAGACSILLAQIPYKTYVDKITNTNNTLILNSLISSDNIYQIDATNKESEDSIDQRLGSIQTLCSGTLQFDIFRNNLYSITGRNTLNLKDYSIIPIFFIGTNKNGNNITLNKYDSVDDDDNNKFKCIKHNLHKFSFTSALYNNYNQVEFTKANFNEKTKFTLVFNNLPNDTYATIIDNVHNFDNQTSIDEIIGKLNNIYYYNANNQDTNQIWILDMSVFQNYVFNGLINLKYEISLQKYKDKNINDYINIFMNLFNTKYLKIYQIKDKYNYDHDYNINCNITNYNNIAEYYTKLTDIQSNIHDVIGDFDLNNIYYYQNKDQIYNLTLNQGEGICSFLNGANINNDNQNLILCNSFDLFTNDLDVCKINDIIKYNNIFHSLWSNKKTSNNELNMVANFKSAGYVINNSTF